MKPLVRHFLEFLGEIITSCCIYAIIAEAAFFIDKLDDFFERHGIDGFSLTALKITARGIIVIDSVTFLSCLTISAWRFVRGYYQGEE